MTRRVPAFGWAGALALGLAVACAEPAEQAAPPAEPEVQPIPEVQPVAEVEPVPEVEPGLTLLLGDSGQKFMGAEVRCPSGWSHHEPLTGGRTTIHGIPDEPDCLAWIKGGGPRVGGVVVPREGTVRCTFVEYGEVDERAAETEVTCLPYEREETTAVTTGELVVEIPTLPGLNSAEVACPSGFREERELASLLRWEGVPREECALLFRGRGPPKKFMPVSGGQHLVCRFAREDRTPTCVPAPG